LENGKTYKTCENTCVSLHFCGFSPHCQSRRKEEEKRNRTASLTVEPDWAWKSAG